MSQPQIHRLTQQSEQPSWPRECPLILHQCSSTRIYRGLRPRRNAVSDVCPSHTGVLYGRGGKKGRAVIRSFAAARKRNLGQINMPKAMVSSVPPAGSGTEDAVPSNCNM